MKDEQTPKNWESLEGQGGKDTSQIQMHLFIVTEASEFWGGASTGPNLTHFSPSSGSGLGSQTSEQSSIPKTIWKCAPSPSQLGFQAAGGVPWQSCGRF